jgi:hypothetical protein
MLKNQIKFINSEEKESGIATGVDIVAKSICGHLNAGDKVLWLIAGGSNVPVFTRQGRLVCWS